MTVKELIVKLLEAAAEGRLDLNRTADVPFDHVDCISLLHQQQQFEEDTGYGPGD